MKKIFYLFPFVYLLFLLARVELALSQDLGRHIKLGEIIWSSWHVPSVNLFSYTMPEASFVNHHWFSEVIFYLLFLLGGIEAIIYWKVIFILLTFGVLFFLGRRLGSVFWVVVLSVPYLYIFSYRFDARPEVFSFFYLSLYLLFIYLYSRHRSYWYLLALVPVQILWVNSHIYFFVGLVVYGAFVFSEFVLGKKDMRLVWIGALLLLCLFVSVNGWEQALVPLRIFSNYGYSIVENQNILFLNSWFFIPQIFVLEIFSLLLVVVCALTFWKRHLFWYLIGFSGLVASFVMVRNLPLFVILSFPLAIYSFGRFEKKYLSSFSVRPIVVALMVVVVVVHVGIGVTSPRFGFFYIEPGKGAVEFIEENGLEGPMFNNFDIGSYLIYKLYPQERVFVDGRPEAYSVEFFERYRRMQENPQYFDEQAEKYDLEMIVFSTTDITPWAQSFLQYLSSQNEWVVVYDDQYSAVLVKKGSENFEKIGRLNNLQGDRKW